MAGRLRVALAGRVGSVGLLARHGGGLGPRAAPRAAVFACQGSLPQWHTARRAQSTVAQRSIHRTPHSAQLRCGGVMGPSRHCAAAAATRTVSTTPSRHDVGAMPGFPTKELKEYTDSLRQTYDELTSLPDEQTFDPVSRFSAHADLLYEFMSEVRCGALHAVLCAATCDTVTPRRACRWHARWLLACCAPRSCGGRAVPLVVAWSCAPPRVRYHSRRRCVLRGLPLCRRQVLLYPEYSFPVGNEDGVNNLFVAEGTDGAMVLHTTTSEEECRKFIDGLGQSGFDKPVSGAVRGPRCSPLTRSSALCSVEHHAEPWCQDRGHAGLAAVAHDAA